MKKKSIQRKLVAIFSVIIISIIIISLFLHIRTAEKMRDLTYEKMQVQAEYYQEVFETELDNILKLQSDFFANQKLVFLSGDNVLQSDYERREALFSVQERVETIAGMSSLVKDAQVYLADAGYKVSGETIRKMDDVDREKMNDYLSESENEYLNYDGQDFYLLMIENPNAGDKCAFVITLSSEQIIKRLGVLNASEKGGAFIYNEKEDVMLENSQAECTGREILARLEIDDKEADTGVKRVKTAEGHYLVSVGENSGLGMFVQYVDERTIMEYSRKSWGYMLAFSVAMVGMAAAFALYTKRAIHKPIQLLLEAFEKVKKGDMKEHISHDKNDEFRYLYEGFNDMEDKLSELIQEVYVQKNLVQKAQLTQLQAQINPHFLYNSFFTLSRCIKIGAYEDAELFTKHLGNYFRFLTRNAADDTTLKQEVSHAESYAAIQGMRFEGRLEIQFGKLPVKFEGQMVPRLILQPLLENAFEHGLENRAEDGILRVSFLDKGKKLEICVEDNGEDVTEETIQKMSRKLVSGEAKTIEEVTGITNIHKRLEYYFKGKGGLSVARSNLGGAAVTISIEWEDIHEPEFADCR